MKKIIVISVATVAILTFSGCNNGDSKAAETAKATTEKAAETTKSVADSVKEAASKTVDAAKETANKAAEATKEAASKATEAVKETASKAADATKEAANKATEAVKETANKAAEATKEVAATATQKAKEAVAGAGDAKSAALFKKCAGCHGADGKTKALGKSEVIAGQNAEDLVKKITAYKAGTRNVAGMGTLMKGQVATMSDEDIKAVAAYISNLK